MSLSSSFDLILRWNILSNEGLEPRFWSIYFNGIIHKLEKKNRHDTGQATNLNKKWWDKKKCLKSLEQNKSPFAGALTYERLLMSLFCHFLLHLLTSISILNSGHTYYHKTSKDKLKYICEWTETKNVPSIYLHSHKKIEISLH